jgi:hypothetical protein
MPATVRNCTLSRIKEKETRLGQSHGLIPTVLVMLGGMNRFSINELSVAKTA